MTTIIVTGGKGQLGLSIKEVVQRLNLHERYRFFYPDIEELDLCLSESQVKEKILQMASSITENREDKLLIINCAAYTAVDQAEQEKEKVYALNVDVPRKLASIVSRIPNAGLIQLSTDFVFDGEQSVPYLEEDGPCPLSQYGLSKLEAEKALMHLSFEGRAIVVRTAWLYSEYGKNFVKTMVRLAMEKDEIGVVSDQIGTPTYAPYLAHTLLVIAEAFIAEGHFRTGLIHCTDSGVASWYDLACVSIGLLSQKQVKSVRPIRTSDYPTAAKRPSYSVLSKDRLSSLYAITHPHWTVGVKDCINRLEHK
ncbi:dTDP-4-dehydrorhamnose reductase [Falsiporphyromonas endometrii]|uniref:dTDP-4-dehydrorhamnose reductase n=1 Tax=Falsiporphyromonas endometrii TaxID=1387297 RepID=A0ABV9K7C6_9PORP